MSLILYSLLGLLFGIIFILWLIGFIARRIVNRKHARKYNEILDQSPYRKKKVHAKLSDDERMKRQENYKDQEAAKEAERQLAESQGLTAVERVDPADPKQRRQNEVSQIIGTVKPRGRYSAAILQEKLSFLSRFIKLQASGVGGFWQNMIKAQGMSQGKNKGRMK